YPEGPPHDRGGGVYAVAGSPTIRNAVFRDNVAFARGGGIYAEGGSPLIEDGLFEDNIANVGGGVHSEGGAPVLRRVTLRRNRAGALAFYGGSTGLVEDAVLEGTVGSGALYVNGSSPRFVRTTLRDNPTGGDTVGAAYISDFASPVFEDCLFENNTSNEAAAALIDGGSTPLFLRTTFRDNRAVYTAGAIRAVLSAPVFLGCRFERNRAGYGAGAISAHNSGVVLLGSTLVGNVAGTA